MVNSTVRVNEASFHVVGVMPEGFRGLAVVAPPDFWAPFSLLSQFRPGREGREGFGGLKIVGRIKPGLSRDQALAQLLLWDSQRAVERSGERPAASLVLEPRLGTVPQPAEAMVLFMPLFLAFGLILVIAPRTSPTCCSLAGSHASGRLVSGWPLVRRGAASSCSCSPRAWCSH